MHITDVTVMGDSGTAYAITVEDGEARCACPAYQFGDGVPCKHMRFVASLLFTRPAP